MEKSGQQQDDEPKTAMVTGATGTLGQATVRALLKAGYRVVVQETAVDPLNEFVEDLGSLVRHDNLYPICFDTTDEDAVAAGCNQIRDDFAPVEILVNNVGEWSGAVTEETSLEEWRRVFAQNVDSAFLMSKALLPAMTKKGWGRIVNTCSLAGKTGGITSGTAFASAKGALHSLTFALARECAKHQVTVNGIAPGYVRNAAIEKYPSEMIEMLRKYIPVGKFCEPEEYAHTVLFLISTKASFITGEIVDMNGGLLMD